LKDSIISQLISHPDGDLFNVEEIEIHKYYLMKVILLNEFFLKDVEKEIIQWFKI
jgi:hypothetical protein